MRTQHFQRQLIDQRASRRLDQETGFALILVMGFLAVSMIVLGGLLSWTSQNALQAQRHQDYHTALLVQNVAGEYVVARMLADLRHGGVERVAADWGRYGGDTENKLDGNPDWADYELAIQLDPVAVSPNLLGSYGGLNVANHMVFEMQSGARWLDRTPPLAVATEEWVQVAEIPVFAFAALYDFDLSFTTLPGQNVTLAGRVHSNKDIYTYPSGTLTFQEHVTSGMTNYGSLHPNDPGPRDPGTVHYEKENGGQVGRMYVPKAGDNPRAFIEKEYLDRADLVITINNDGILAMHDISDVSEYVTNFVSTGTVFWDRRELKTVHATEIDLEKYFLEDHAKLADALGTPPRIIYVEDLRTHGTEAIPGVRLRKGYVLPAGGLTIVTPNPLYVLGSYNAGNKRAAALVADAVTVLSEKWADPGSTITLAEATTVNSAILTGIVPSEGGSFDGGFFNTLRLLEDWRGVPLTFNGSIVALYRSQQAIEPWRDDGSIYYRPTRHWAFDLDFLTPGHLPWSPVVCTLIRTEWSLIPPDQVFSY
jgi:hypothetical protein